VDRLAVVRLFSFSQSATSMASETQFQHVQLGTYNLTNFQFVNLYFAEEDEGCMLKRFSSILNSD
jgi:hypothetical protein